MMCHDARKLLPDLALGDLDAEPAAEVAAHVSSCAACRTEEAALGRTLGALRATAPLSPSTQRRSAAAAAMARAHAEQSERLLVRRPLSWKPWAMASAFLLVLAAALSLRGGGSAFSVMAVTGGAQLLDRENGFWHPVLGGMRIGVGDRIVTEPGCVIRLSDGPTELYLDQETSIEVVARRRVTLDRGQLLAVASTSDVLVITDVTNNSATVNGRAEVSLRDVPGRVLGFSQVKGAPPEMGEEKIQVKKSLVAKVQSGEVALDGDKDQRLRASAGQQGMFKFGGQPETAPLDKAGVGTWADPASGKR